VQKEREPTAEERRLRFEGDPLNRALEGPKRLAPTNIVSSPTGTGAMATKARLAVITAFQLVLWVYLILKPSTEWANAASSHRKKRDPSNK
jgi:hypothetical protein